MGGIVVVFDFDLTILDCDSDNWVIDELSATDLFNHLRPTMPWNSLMDRMMMEIHSQGKTIEDVAQVLKKVPMHPRIVPAIKAAHALGCDLRIVSDANAFFIETILEHLGIKQCFTEINTNPGFVDGEGRLRVLPYHDFTKSPHGCPLCPPNMCKGKIIEKIQERIREEGKKKRMIYVGDGSGDYCPSMKLRESDFVMPRRDFPVWDLISREPSLLKAQVHGWSNGQDLETILFRLIHQITSQDQSSFSSVIPPSDDCKNNVHDPLPPPPPSLPLQHTI
ncbi:inorganic pyrophosphatase 2-like [Neltuma alba]|uniref:inorganic pyrophosphatase 2-like n=1 Tax=Neltuma alba TaxID=207710 RepID=UPI0010A5750F|nr:inorganic pyrophosphatase 2-like [Prosopis alba]